jgi:polar amino acid transport system substrate-binding protein
MRRRIAGALAATILAVSPALAQERRLVRIATEGAFPPFNFIEQNAPQGFEVDLGRALCDAAQLNCTFVLHEWEGIIRGLVAGKYDAIMASLAITEKRKAQIAFTRRYYRIPIAFIAAKDGDLKEVMPEALAGKRIGTTEGRETSTFLQERYKNADIRVFGSVEEAGLDLLTGRIDLVFGDKLALSRFLERREGACCSFIGDAPVPPNLDEGVAIGLRKEDVELRERFNGAIEQVIADGTYDRIREKYFSFDIK